jgi:hypothetical protein
MPGYLKPGATFAGPVALVIDGDSLCVAVGPGPSNLVEVRLADFYAPESSQPGGRAAKTALEQVALGQEATCIAGFRTYDRIAARCSIAGRPLGDSLRALGVREGGNGTASALPRAVRPGGSSPSVLGSNPFRSCAEARAAGAAPVYRGSPGYNPNLDGDGDGIACEPYRGR